MKSWRLTKVEKTIVKWLIKGYVIGTITINVIVIMFRVLGDYGDKNQYYKLSSIFNPFSAFDELVIEVQKIYNDEKECYVINSKGEYEKTFCFKEKHPVYGTKPLPYNDSLAVIINRGVYKRFIIPTIKTQYFTPNGLPLIYYYRYPDNRIELFSYCGYHPQFNEKLLPISKEICVEIFNHIEHKNYSFFVREKDFEIKEKQNIKHYLYKHRDILSSL